MTAKSLEALDRQVRVAVRKWLRLPHDTHTALFHANAGDGGLEVPRLRYLIPLMKAYRMAKLEESDDSVTQVVLYCIVFIHFYSASHSLSLSEALPNTAIDTVSEFTRRSATGNCKRRTCPRSLSGG